MRYLSVDSEGIVLCAMSDLPVHQLCYSIKRIPSGEAPVAFLLCVVQVLLLLPSRLLSLSLYMN